MQKEIRAVSALAVQPCAGKLTAYGAKIANYTAVSLFARHHDSMLLQFTITDPTERLNAVYGVQLPSDWAADDSIKYGKQGLIVRHDQCGKRQAMVRRMLGAADALTIDKRWFKSTAFKVCQCIVPINGYRVCSNNIWYEVTMKDGSLMHCAAICEGWQSKGGDIREGIILLTTAANVLLAPLYNKMPVLLHQRELDSWLRGERPILQELNRIASPYPSELMQVNKGIMQ